MTRRLFPDVSELELASMASSCEHVAATPSTWPRESLRVSRVHGDNVATVSVPHREGANYLVTLASGDDVKQLLQATPSECRIKGPVSDAE